MGSGLERSRASIGVYLSRAVRLKRYPVPHSRQYPSTIGQRLRLTAMPKPRSRCRGQGPFAC